MPDDLLSYLGGPPGYGTGWLWAAAGLVALVIGWYVAVLWWTAPGRGGEPALVASARGALIRRRSIRAIREAGHRYGAGDLTAAAAAAEVSRTVRRFLRETTGQRVEYLQLPDLSADLAPALPVLTDLADAQFNRHSRVDVGAAGLAAEELVRRWT